MIENLDNINKNSDMYRLLETLYKFHPPFYMDRWTYEKEEQNRKNILSLEAQQKEIDKIDLCNYPELLLNLISQLSDVKQKQLKAIIYQNKILDEKYPNKYKLDKVEMSGGVRLSFTNFFKPYELDEINKYEEIMDITLPLELKIYLTCISSSVYKTHLDYTKIILGNLEKMPAIVEGVGYFHQTSQYIDSDLDDEEYNIKLEELCKIKDTTVVLKLRGCGCGYTDVLILNDDKNHGQVWHEKFAGDGVFYKVNESFFDYALIIISN
jgi:hypothetical protein